jgi:phosphoglycerol transferase MdoB-like AlkP superfamily enzyme
MKIKPTIYATSLSAFINLMWAYVAYFVCRLAYGMENWSVLGGNFTSGNMGEVLKGGLMFDTSAIMYTNSLYMVLMLFPLHVKECRGWQKMAKCVFVVVNALAICINLADSVYFKYTGRRTTATIFSEFGNEGNLGSVIGVEFLNHWYLVLLAIVLIVGLVKLYVMPASVLKIKSMFKYYVVQLLALLLFLPMCIGGMRGGLTKAVRPITISNANQYVDRPEDAALVLNTPFSLIRTIGKNVFVIPNYMEEDRLNEVYSPVRQFVADSVATKKKNVVVMIVESFGSEYIGALNDYEGYTPFLDSLISKSLIWEHSFGNGRKSIDGMPSVLSSIPMFVEPFFLTPASVNNVGGLARELVKDGYYSAFFHGAENGSMGFQAFSRATGFEDYFGRTEYNQDNRFQGDADFDGMWAIWDEPFLQYMALTMNEFREPFVSAVFTASSHHPYKIPEAYQEIYPEEGLVMHKCVRYTDHALKRFFETASKQPWFKNTLFVMTADHTNLSEVPEYQTSLGGFRVPIVFFDPSGEMPTGQRKGIAQQIDIMPTVLGYLGYTQPYVAFGFDLFHTPAEDTWAVNYLNGIYQYVKGDYLIQFDGVTLKAVYRFKEDKLLEHNLIDKVDVSDLVEELKAIIQSYMQRMNTNALVM